MTFGEIQVGDFVLVKNGFIKTIRFALKRDGRVVDTYSFFFNQVIHLNETTFILAKLKVEKL